MSPLAAARETPALNELESRSLSDLMALTVLTITSLAAALKPANFQGADSSQTRVSTPEQPKHQLSFSNGEACLHFEHLLMNLMV